MPDDGAGHLSGDSNETERLVLVPVYRQRSRLALQFEKRRELWPVELVSRFMARLTKHGLKPMRDEPPELSHGGYALEVFMSKADVERLEGIVGRIDTETTMTLGQAISYLIQLEAARQIG